MLSNISLIDMLSTRKYVPETSHCDLNEGTKAQHALRESGVITRRMIATATLMLITTIKQVTLHVEMLVNCSPDSAFDIVVCEPRRESTILSCREVLSLITLPEFCRLPGQLIGAAEVVQDAQTPTR